MAAWGLTIRMGAAVLAAGGLVLSAPRADAAKRKPRVRFQQGTVTGGDLGTTAWTATLGRRLYGSLAEEDVFKMNRLLGEGSTSVTGGLFNPQSRRIGSFSAAVSPAAVTGTYRTDADVQGSFDNVPVARSRAATRRAAGTYYEPQVKSFGGSVLLRLQSSGRFSLTGELPGYGRLVNVAGYWMADADGSAWFLATKAVYRQARGLPRLDVIKQGAPTRLGYRLRGRNLRLVDPFDPDRELVKLVRR